MRRRPPVLVLLGAALLAAAGCRDSPPRETPLEPPPDTASVTPSDSVRGAPPDSLSPTPFDAAPIIFDTLEPPERIVQIPSRPPPRPPDPRPRPTPRPPPPPPDDGPSGNCDVRETEGYCFTYSGPGWDVFTAEDHCSGAPNSTYGPGTCPLDGRIGTCAFRRPSAPGYEIVYTYYEPYDLTLAELACPGTFTRLRSSR